MSRRSVVDDETVEAFLGLVSQHEALWDVKNTRYKDQETQANAWKSIARKMAFNDGNCSPLFFSHILINDNPILEGMFWKRKFRNLRDTYVKEKRLLKTSSGQGAKKKTKQWKHFDSFAFMEVAADEK